MGRQSDYGARVAALAEQPPWREVLDSIGRDEDELAEETIRVTRIPAPTFAEERRAAYVAERFHELGLRSVEIAADRNVYGLLPGTGAGGDRAALALFAHIDTVFGPEVSVEVTRRDGRLYAPGVGDNSAGVAGTLTALRAMQRHGVLPERPVWVVATVGEEGLGDLCGAKAATDRLGGLCDAVIAVEGSFFGRVSHTGVGSRRWRVTMRAGGGHSWHDFGRPSAVHALARAAAAITRIDVPAHPRTTFNIGEISGGTGVNVIAEQASLLLDLRSVTMEQLDRAAARVRAILEDSRREGVEVEITEVGNRPAGELTAQHPLVKTCVAILQHLGAGPQYAAASTDANVPLSRAIPALTLGITRGGGAHTVGEWIETAPMVKGVQQLVLVIAACAAAEPWAVREQ